MKWWFLQDYVYVYDGIPSFMTSSSSSSATLLAAYCGYGLDEPYSVEAKSGYLTVYFEGNIEPSMFICSLDLIFLIILNRFDRSFVYSILFLK